MGWFAALLVILLSWLLVYDIRRRETALVIMRARREGRPIAYWAIMAFWLLCLLLSALLTLGSYFYETACEGKDPCVIIVQALPQ